MVKNRVLTACLVMVMSFLMINSLDTHAQKPIPSQIRTFKTPSETVMLKQE
jgi:hypothetical protein